MAEKFARTCGVALLAACLLSCATTSTQAPEPQVALETEIVYGTGGDANLLLDLARPTNGAGPFPAVVLIHGDGWREGSRVEYEYDIQRAAAQGYVAVTVNYRLTVDTENGRTKYPFPAQVNDVKCAVRWMRANAEKYRIDPDHIGAYGFSAGGHLALLLGLTRPSDGLEGKGPNMEYSSAVQAVVDSAGPTELSSLPPVLSFICQKLLGGTPKEVPEQYEKASPITYVRKDSPPVLTISGDEDGAAIEQARLLDEKMNEAGARHTLIVKPGKGHEDFIDDPAVWDFFAKNLKVPK